MPYPTTNPNRASSQQYWHSTSFTSLYLRTTLRTLQFACAIIILGLYGSECHYRNAFTDTPITNEIYALVVGLLSVITVGIYCFLTVKRVQYVLWDFVLCVLYAALAGTFGGTYLVVGGEEELLAEDRVRSLRGMKAAVIFDLIGLVLWLVTFLQGSIWCCKARRFTRRTDVESATIEANVIPQMLERERRTSTQTTLCAESFIENDEKGVKEIC
jgi:hypothetical protein